MSTRRPRHVVTETDELARALDATAHRWPDLSRPQLLVHLALEGARSELEKKRSSGLPAIEQSAGALTGSYGPGYLEQLDDDWPA